jgi:hypothetical protein
MHALLFYSNQLLILVKQNFEMIRNEKLIPMSWLATEAGALKLHVNPE